MADTQKPDAVAREERILEFWKNEDIFKKTLKKPAPKGEFVFYEGPPTANGRPGVHHIESRSFKDALPRYKTMRGYHVPRRAGWDTHGLPVELGVEKQLGFSGKKDIEAYGIEAFNKKCRESVMMYVDEWDRFTKRIGYWVDQEDAYFTFDTPFMESVWNIVKQVSDAGRLFKDYKVIPWCARCGTALSSHELAQGYQNVKDLSITAKFELVDTPKTFILAWTTTPWTLPGNVGLAVGEKIQYGLYTKDDESVIVATSRASVLGEGWSLEREFPGSELVGKAYKPLYTFAETLASESEKPKFSTTAFKLYAAPFVTTEDGTGIVHTAVMYGQEDFELGQKVGLPKVHLVGADGKFVPGTGFLEGRFVKEEDENGKPTLAVDIVDDLTARGLFFAKENHLHSYPFCWRCKTPLIYYARDSWYIRMMDLKEKLLEANSAVNWEPAHIRDGRMGEWLQNVRDWSLSRERYWGTPLPVWKSADGSKQVVIGSVEELKKQVKKSGNRYLAIRHGESEMTLAAVVSSDQTKNPLTEKGRERVRARAEELKADAPTRIFTSPLLRTKQSAEILREVLGLPEDRLVVDDRLREISFGELEDHALDEFLAWRKEHAYTDAPTGGESYADVRNRFGSFIYEVEKKYQNETILIVTHGCGLESLSILSEGLSTSKAKARLEDISFAPAEVFEVPFVPLPHNDSYELDLHRPYIDEVLLLADDGTELMRTPEVMDVWLDSGAMPFAQDHYPFENKEKLDTVGFPADFISEAIDQTRGWFYTLLAVGVLMGRSAPYKNVICLGHLLDMNGQKMSKSKGNIINPWEAIEQHGIDTLRFWMYSVNQPGDSKNFDEKTVKESARVISWLDNSAKFYALFKDAAGEGTEQVIDRWMEARVSETVRDVTVAMDAYKLYDASRTIARLIEDVSQWYVRRIRDRVRDGDQAALATLRHTLKTCALLLAPLSPFIAEDVYQLVRSKDEPESVHLASWPETGTGFFARLLGKEAQNEKLIEDMVRVRALASEALMLRQKADRKVRQPLAALSVPGTLPDELKDILKEEVNVKEVVDGVAEMSLNIELTPELIREGDARAFMRAVAEARKERNLSPKDTVRITAEEAGKEILQGVTIPGTAGITFESHSGTHTAELSFGKIAFDLVVDAA